MSRWLLCIPLILTVAACPLSAVAHAVAGPTARQLSSNIAEVAALSNHRALAFDVDGNFKLFDLDTLAAQDWHCDWVPTAHGWSGSGAPCCLLANADGTKVTFETGLEPDIHAWAVLVCNADGSQGRIVALHDPFIALGSERRFSRDGRYLIDYLFFGYHVPATDGSAWREDFLKFRRHLAELESSASGPRDFAGLTANAYDFAAGKLVELPGFVNEWDADQASPYGDYRIGFDDGDCFQRLVGGRWVHAGTVADGLTAGANWIAPQLMLTRPGEGEGPPQVLRADGKIWRAPPGQWDVFAYLPDRRSFFTRDGRTVELGRISWRTGQVTRRVKCSELARFIAADPAAEGALSWAWTPLPDSSGALVLGGEDNHELWVVRD